MKKYSKPMILGSSGGFSPAPAAAALVAGLAKGATVGVAAMLGVMGAKKVLGDIVEVKIPALEPCFE